MNLVSKASPRRNNLLPVAYLALLVACGILAGCGQKETPVASAPSSLKGQSPAVPAGEVVGTPEQEAAKQRAIQQGPAIEAALKEQQEHK